MTGWKAPCMNCTDKYMGCHSNCQKYIDFATMRRNANKEQVIDGVIRNIHKERYRKGHKKS